MAEIKTSSVICIASSLDKDYLAKLDAQEKPDLNIKWTPARNNFVAFQSYFKVKKPTPVEDIVNPIKSVYESFFPMELEPIELVFFPDMRKPQSLNLDLKVMYFKEKTMEVTKMLAEFQAAMRESVADINAFYKSMETRPRLHIAKVPKEEQIPDNANIRPALDIPLIKERFYLTDLMLVEVTKDEFGIVYNYHPIA